ncbi:MAG: hypothetical protein IT169_06725 [Bryobacterales bacterium]|nr:hypothetical protein [Bryobacterales bacterium]
MESLAEAVTSVFASASLGSEHIEQARARFALAEEQYESVLPAPRRKVALNLRQSFVAAAMVACIAALTWQTKETAAPELLKEARDAELAWNHSQPVMHTRMQVEMQEVRPGQRRMARTLELWTDRDSRRSALRWSNTDGGLQYAVWRSGEGKERVFRTREPAPTETGAVSLSALLREEPSLDRLEMAFLAWLASHEWRPVALSENISEFASVEGSSIRAERKRGKGGSPEVWLTITRPNMPVRAEIVLQLNAESLRPRFERIRLYSPDSEVTLNATVEQSTPSAVRDVDTRVFDAPPAPLQIASVRRVPNPVIALPPALPEARSPGLEDFDSAQIDALYVIHRAGACLDGSIEVLRESPKSVVVRGQLGSSAERAALEAQFAHLRSHGLIRLELGVPQLHAIAPPPVVRTVVVRSPERTPVHELLERAGGKAGKGTELANNVVSTSGEAMSHAWALARLAKLSRREVEGLRPESKWLLERMVRDHLDRLEAAAASLGDAFQPLAQAADATGAGDAAPPVGWSSGLLDVFEQTRAVDGLIQALAASAGLENRTAAEAASELCSRLARLRGRLPLITAAVEQELDQSGAQLRPHK